MKYRLDVVLPAGVIDRRFLPAGTKKADALVAARKRVTKTQTVRLYQGHKELLVWEALGPWACYTVSGLRNRYGLSAASAVSILREIRRHSPDRLGLTKPQRAAFHDLLTRQIELGLRRVCAELRATQKEEA